jgi:hypothetical protein
VNENIFLTAHLADCLLSKHPALFFKLSSNKQLTYSLTNALDWELFLKEYRKELAKKGDDDAAAEITFPDKICYFFASCSYTYC